jgi:hypothetical protein
MPVSGMAKQLKTNNRLSAPAFRSAFDRSVHEQLILLLILAALIACPFVLRRFAPLQRALFAAALLFPFLYICILSLRSDWPLWDWYLYAFRPALCAAFAVLCAIPLLHSVMQHRLAAAALALFVLFEAAHFQWPYQGRASLLDAAVDAERFAETHPGIYAMGDRSGITGYLLPDPLIQTEGLVMDRPFLNRIRERQPLLAALAAYRVRYYIANGLAPLTGCFYAVEPMQAGPASPHMLAKLCFPPVATFVHGTHYTFIYDLQTNSP